MKTVITSTGDKPGSGFDMRFGRAAWFCLYNEDSGKTDFIRNNHAESNNGAGTKAAELMVELGVSKVISGDFGPKAKELLEKFNIQMVIVQNESKIENIIQRLKK